MAAPEPEVLFQRGPTAGVVTLNRPKALNSLNLPVIETLLKLYQDWEHNESVHCIIIKGAGGKAFCAGGDVKGVVLNIMNKHYDVPLKFFKAEYKLNFEIGTLAKPHIALLDGIVMGGGAGVSIHGRFRIATEKSLFAMPECGIGLFPDVGASHFLNRLPGKLGMYLALTGARLKGVQLKEAQLATHYIPSEQLPAVEQRIQALGPAASKAASVADVLRSFEGAASQPEPSDLPAQLPAIDACFSKDSLEGIYAALEARQDQWSQDTLATLMKGSPLSQKVTFREMTLAASMSLAECLQQDYRLAHHMVCGQSDFVEGVRALLIDKDNKPRWRYSSIQEVPDEEVASFFAPLPPDQELHLAGGRSEEQQPPRSRLCRTLEHWLSRVKPSYVLDSLPVPEGCTSVHLPVLDYGASQVSISALESGSSHCLQAHFRASMLVSHRADLLPALDSKCQPYSAGDDSKAHAGWHPADPADSAAGAHDQRYQLIQAGAQPQKPLARRAGVIQLHSSCKGSLHVSLEVSPRGRGHTIEGCCPAAATVHPFHHICHDSVCAYVAAASFLVFITLIACVTFAGCKLRSRRRRQRRYMEAQEARQACAADPRLVAATLDAIELAAGKAGKQAPQCLVDEDHECPVCWETVIAAPNRRTWVEFGCGHGMCKGCFHSMVAHQLETATCPLCREPLLPKGTEMAMAQVDPTSMPHGAEQLALGFTGGYAPDPAPADPRQAVDGGRHAPAAVIGYACDRGADSDSPTTSRMPPLFSSPLSSPDHSLRGEVAMPSSDHSLRGLARAPATGGSPPHHVPDSEASMSASAAGRSSSAACPVSSMHSA
ncbi:hypothetical protein WJX72_008922 [[Myrmecia] bisecta]|uniref:3-hydroxyisobutyryl-CoA hydrolase n=1 Tax=[Myrmecia] bisecta TaxID=41462 RepID=A0AAW1Q2Q5_9CHLO